MADTHRPARPVASSLATAPLRWVRQRPRLVCCVAGTVVALLALHASVGWYQVSSRSMSPTLRPRDRVLVNKLAYGAAVPWTDWRVCYRRPHRGAVITFYPPFVSHRTFMRPQFVKRIIGMPGDTLEMRAGRLYVNQRSMIEPYAVHGGTPDTSFVTMTWQRGYLARQVPPASYRPTRDHWGPLLVPASQYFVLGDHRDESADSRYWGFVPAHVITGTPVWVWRPAH